MLYLKNDERKGFMEFSDDDLEFKQVELKKLKPFVIILSLQQSRQKGNDPGEEHQQHNADHIGRQKKGHAFKHLI